MYIVCPNCKTNFVVAADVFNTKARKVKCCKCQHIWYHRPIQLQSLQQQILPQKVQQRYHVPVIIQQKKISWLSIAAIILILIYVAILGVMRYKTWQNTLYQKGLQLEIVRLEYLDDQLLLEYRILNKGDLSSPPPNIQIALLGERRKVIAATSFKAIALSPYRYLYMQTTFQSLAAKINVLEISF